MNAAGEVVKMHGAENTFVVLDARSHVDPRLSRLDARAFAELAPRLCALDGPMEGADGVLVIGDSGSIDSIASMRIFNADGSEAGMCGNGMRCVARYLFERGAERAFSIATLAGAIGVEVVSDDPFAARLDMGAVRFPSDARAETFDALGRTWTFHDVSLGNPHAIVFVDEAEAQRIDLDALGRAAQIDAAFPAGINVHLVSVASPERIRVRHFERGVGQTRACGTGAVAAAAATISLRAGVSPMTVDVPGGRLLVAWNAGERARLTGPAQTMFARRIAL